MFSEVNKRLSTVYVVNSDLHALHYANELLVCVRLAFQKLYLFPAFGQFRVLLFVKKTN